MDRAAAEQWIREAVEPTGPIETVHEEPWSTVRRVPTADGIVFFKACAPVQDFEPRLTAELARRSPDLLPQVIAHDTDRGWMLLADAGTRLADVGNPPESWVAVLPRYAEFQRGEANHAADHLAHGVPDLRLSGLPARFDDLLRQDLPLTDDEISRLRTFAPRFGVLCAELDAQDIPPSIQHDDLHMNNVFDSGGELRILDWGDSSVAHPFASLVCTFRFLEERNGLGPDDPWFARLRDAYLEPWGSDLTETFGVAMQVGSVAHGIAVIRQRDALPEDQRPALDEDIAVRLRRALSICGG